MYRLALVLLIACCNFAPFTAELINRGYTDDRLMIDDQHPNEHIRHEKRLHQEDTDEEIPEDAFDRNDNNDDNDSNQMEYGNDVAEEPEGEEDEFGNKNELVNNPKAWLFLRRYHKHRYHYYRRRRYIMAVEHDTIIMESEDTVN